MYPIHDHDTLLLLATALAAKRRPAELPEIMAAIDLIQGNIPAEQKLSEAFARLGQCGLLVERDAGVALTPGGEKLIEALPRKGEMADRLVELRGLLGAYVVTEGTAIAISPEVLREAMLAHRAAAAGGAKNLLVPKPKPEAAQARPGQRQRKPMPKQRKR